MTGSTAREIAPLSSGEAVMDEGRRVGTRFRLKLALSVRMHMRASAAREIALPSNRCTDDWQMYTGRPTSLHATGYVPLEQYQHHL